MLHVILAAAVLTIACMAPMRAAAPAPPTVELELRPRVALLTPRSSGVQVLATLRVYNPSAELRCAAEWWDFGDGSRSGHEEDCSPDELEPWYPGVPMVVSRTNTYRRRGVYEVVVELRNSYEVLERARATVAVGPPDDDDDELGPLAGGALWRRLTASARTEVR